MAILVADSSGNINGKFTIPTGVPAGSKLVSFEGAGGSNASAVFIGQGIERRDVRQEVTTRTSAVRRPIDPLAQTFSIENISHIGGVELFVTAKGNTPIIVQIRDTQVGFPTRTVLAEALINPADLNVDAWNRWAFDEPIVLQPQTEYAIVVLCNDADGAIAIAELGKFDAANQSWVTSQPFQVGVLLASSNASTWTAYQDRDMAFRLLAANYTESERIIDLGAVPVVGATDIIVMAPAIQPASGADCEIIVELPGGETFTASDRQVVRFPVAITGDINMSVRLRATENLSALLYPGSQIVVGVVDLEANYVSRAIAADAAGTDVRIIFDALLPSGASVDVKVSGVDISDTWVAATQVGTAKPLGNGVFEYEYLVEDVEEARVRVGLDLTGTINARPIIANLRASVV